MPADFLHPRDPSTLLAASPDRTGGWTLSVNGRRMARRVDEAGSHLTLADGSQSYVEVTERRFDDLPVFVIDGVSYPMSRDLGILPVLSIALPLLSLMGGIIGILVGVTGVVVTFRVARRWGPGASFLSGVGFLLTAWVGANLFFRFFAGDWAYPIPAQPEIPTLAILPAVAEIPAGGAARYALTRLPSLPPNAATPIGTDPVPAYTIAELETLRANVLAGRFADAESSLVSLEREARADVRRESRWREAYRMGFQAQPDTFSAMLDRWVAASPSSAVPRTARAWNRYWQAYYWSGEGVDGMDAERLRGWGNAFANASDDAIRVLALDPDMLPAYWVLQNIARTERDHEVTKAMLARALERSPTSYETYTFAMQALLPVWGGDSGDMARLAEAAATSGQVALNPDLAQLRGYEEWAWAERLVESGSPQGIQSARTAVRAGQEYRFLETLGHTLFHAGQYDLARMTLDRAVELDPTNEKAYRTRYKLLERMAQTAGPIAASFYEARDADLRLLYALRPMMRP